MPGFCTNCGAPLAAAFCTRCGQRAQTPAPNQPAPQPVSADAGKAPVQQPVPASPASSTPASPQPASVPAAASVTQPPSQPAAPASTASPQQPAASYQTPSQPAVTMQTQTAPTPAAPPAAMAKKSGIGKALLMIGGIILVLCLAAFGAVLYGVHWVRSKVSSATGGVIGGSSQVQVSRGNTCSLLSTQELQQVLGVTVERSSEIMEGNDPGCAYYTNPAAFSELQKMALAQAKRDSERASQDPDVKNSKSDNPLALLKHTEEMEGMMKGLGALSQPNPDGKVFSFTVDRNFGSGNWDTLRPPMSVVPGFKEIEGVGDHAMMGSFGHAFYVLKGDSMVHLDTMYVPETRQRGAELGRKIVARF